MNAVAAAAAATCANAPMVWNKGHHDDNDVGRGDMEENEVDLDVAINTEVFAKMVRIRVRCAHLTEALLRSSVMQHLVPTHVCITCPHLMLECLHIHDRQLRDYVMISPSLCRPHAHSQS